MVKQPYAGLVVYVARCKATKFVDSARESMPTKVVVKHGYHDGERARLFVVLPNGEMWDIFASSAFRNEKDALAAIAQIGGASCV